MNSAMIEMERWHTANVNRMMAFNDDKETQTMNTVSNTNYDGYRWQNDVHCRYIEEPTLVQYTPADDKDGLWVKTIHNDGRIEWAERQPEAQP